MDDEIIIDKIEWTAPEYNHKERSNDWLWTVGLIALVGAGIALWFHNYLFTVFILVSGACLIVFSIRTPEEVSFIIETKGITIGKDFFDWKRIKSFNIKKGLPVGASLNESEPSSKLLIETNKHFLPIYTLTVPESLIVEVKESLLKIIPSSELEESKSVQFMEKIGF